MSTCGGSNMNRKTASKQGGNFKLAPTARAIALALTLSAGGMVGTAQAASPRPFSGDWFVAKGASQSAGLPSGGAGGSSVMTLTQQQQANQQLQLSVANLGKAAAAIAAQQAMQAATHQTALSTPDSVPNGLTTGGLQVDTNPATAGWLNASAPTQSTVNGQTTVTINQTQDKAILNWQTFNVGKNTEVDFNQQSTWAVLNRVNDPNAQPSEIEGQINGAGTVLLINRNGIIFSGSSQVNVRNLVAAAADFSDSQFTTNGIYSPSTSSSYSPAFTDAAGQVQVAAGAQINTDTPSSVTQSGGYVLLLGTGVQNAGAITTTQGQTELAAGDNFLIRPGYSTSNNTTSTTYGNEVAVQLNTLGSSTTGGSGTVINTGMISSPTGDITLAGETVTQDGLLLSTTSVNERGTIHLLSSVSDAFANVTLADNSLSVILPDDSGATALNGQRAALIAASATQNALRAQLNLGQFDDLSLLADSQDESRVEIVTGGSVDFQGGSLTLANGGQVAVSAAKRVQVDTGAVIDVSGLENVALPMSANAIAIDVEGNELRDDPQNRDTGTLFNDTLYVDAQDLTLVPAGTGGDASDRYYTAGGLLEVSGYLDATPHTIGEWMATGGTITLSANQVVAQSGSTFNIAGGSLQYQGGELPQSYIMATNGQIYNVNTAPADLTYTGVYDGFVDDHPRWGISQTYTNVLIAPTEIYWPGYTVGRDAGSVILSTPTAVFAGTIDAAVTASAQQTAARPATVTDPYLLTQNTIPLPGVLSIDNGTATNFLPTTYAPVVTVGASDPLADTLSVTTAIPTDREGTVSLDAAQLSSDGLGGLTINAGVPTNGLAGSITLSDPLTLADGGQVNFTAPAIALNASITAHDGAVTMTANGGNGLTATASANEVLANLTLAQNTTIDTTGVFTNAVLDPLDQASVAFINGGAVSLTSTGNLVLNTGSLIDASSGGAILQNGVTKGGSGGAITLTANSRSSTADTTSVFGGQGLVLGGTLRSEGVSQGGALTLSTAGLVNIGNSAMLADGQLAAGTPAPTTLTLADSLTLAAGTVMPFNYAVQSTVVGPGQSFPSSTNLGNLSQPVTIGSAWTPPSNVYGVNTQNNGYVTRFPVPAGSVITAIYGAIPAGYVVPANVFTNGLPVPAYTASLPKGTVLTNALTLPAGTLISQGTVLAENITAQELDFSPSFFSQGFSAYNITAENVQVAPGTAINVTEPVLQFTNASYAQATGSYPESALSLWTPPLYLANPVTGTLTQRAGASLTLNAQVGYVNALTALSDGSINGASLAPLTVGQGASLTVDPGQSVALNAWGELDVEGSVTAHGGSISLLNSRPFELETTAVGDTADPALSIWIGGLANLDVSGEAVTTLDQQGRAFGIVQNGGTITLGGTSISSDGGDEGIQPSTEAFVVIRPGALLDANGAAATIDLAAGTNPSIFPKTVSGGTTLDATDGGTISLSSYSGLYIDGTLEAQAGGAGAAGGTLNLTLESPIYTTNGLTHAFTLGNAARQLRILTVNATAQPSSLSATLAPGAADPDLVVGTGAIGVDQIDSGGFANLSLYGGDGIAFNGSVNLSLAQSLSLNQGDISLSSATPNANVILSAPSVLLNGDVGHIPNGDGGDIPYSDASVGAAGTGTLSIDANQISIENSVGFGTASTITEANNSQAAGPQLPGFGTVNLVSQGDITFLADSSINASAGLTTSLITAGNLDLTAARIYPATGVTAYVIAGYPTVRNPSGQLALSPTGTINIANFGATPDTAVPDSVFGALLLEATTINQGGVVEAPLGALYIGGNASSLTAFGGSSQVSGSTATVNFLPGSITSVSASGLTMPYGGTSDDINYYYNGTLVSYLSPFNADGRIIPNSGSTQYNAGNLTQGLEVNSQSINVQSGALLNLSGGGNLAGAGFISGEGGSVDVLRTPLVNANPTNAGAASDQVYAIVPGYSGPYAPIAPDAGAGNPLVGETITIGSGVPGLPAGTYTLLPSTYALQPGAYRVEIGGTNTKLAVTGTAALPTGSYEIAGNLGIANTGTKNALPNEIILTPAKTVATYSDYNQESYAQFAIAQAALFGTPLPSLPIDAQLLMLNFSGSSNIVPALTMNGALDQAPATQDGLTGASGTLIVNDTTANTNIDILGPGQSPIAGALSLYASDLDNFHAGALVIGGTYSEFLSPGDGIEVNSTTPDNLITYKANSGNVTVESGATLTAPQIVLLGSQTVTLDSGATLSTIGQGAAPWDSSTDGVVAMVQGVVLSNGAITLTPWIANVQLGINASSNAVNVQSGATLLAGGILGFGATNGLTLGSSVTLGANSMVVAVPSVNIGTSASLAAAQAAGILPATGWALSDTAFNDLLAGNSGAGVPPLQSLVLSVSSAVNFFGTVDISTIDPTTGKSDLSLVLNTPAIYGYGTSSDVATLTTGTLTWSGVTTGSTEASTLQAVNPPAPTANGPGTGSGTLDLVVQNIIFGYGPNAMPQDQISLPRQALGFSTVNLQASQSITANNSGTLAVYQSQTGSTDSGGTLNLVTPLLTGAAGSVMSYTTGGALNIIAPAGAAPSATAATDTLGAEVDLTAASVSIDTAVALPSGKLSVSATGDITLGSNADVDLSGRVVPMFDQTEYSWGGDVSLASAQSNITQAAGSVIDVSAVDNTAGSVTAEAVATGAGQVAFDGTLFGSSTGGYEAGSITVDAQTLSSGSGSNLTNDFATLNTALDNGGVFGARSFDLKQGDLTITAGQTVKAQTVSISVDNGNLTVNGTVDASGATPGSITLSAMNNLTLGGSGLLDAHGNVLQVDSYGNPIDAENRATVTLTAATGTLTLGSGATIDVSSPETTPQGQVVLNAPRLGGTGVSATSGATITDANDGSLTTGTNVPTNAQGNDIAISATGSLTIKGAQSIALNGFATYKNAPADPNDSNGQVIDQAYLDLIDQDSQVFISNIYGGNVAGGVLSYSLQSRLAGLVNYGSNFHIRPGVEIDSATPGGDLSTSGDIDLSGYRYGPNANRDTSSSTYGAGEPMDLVLRAGGNLTITGSISDGFGLLAAVAGIPRTYSYTGIVANIATDPVFSYGVIPYGDGVAQGYYEFSENFYLTTAFTVPNDSFYNDFGGLEDANSGKYYLPGQTIPAGTLLSGSFGVAFEAGINMPGIATGETVLNPGVPASPAGPATSPSAPMLAPGSLSASIRMVAGADLAAADTRTLLPQSVLNGSGNMLLDASAEYTLTGAPAVIRTGTGDLDLYAGGNFSQNSLYGIYTAGMQSADVTAAYDLPQADVSSANYQAYYPTNGGDLTLVAQGNVTSWFVNGSVPSNNIGNWLWEQGGSSIGEQAAWWINFGADVEPRGNTGAISNTTPVFAGFSGIGTLGGGNLTVIAGGNAGIINASSADASDNPTTTTALSLTVASTGRVLANGTLGETGGGKLTLDVGGSLNGGEPSGVNLLKNQDWGVITDLRGNATIKAGSVGQVALGYMTANADSPLPANPLAAVAASATGGPVLAPGDSVMTIETRGDLVLGDAVDPGRQISPSATTATVNGQTGDALSWFTLWTANSGISLISAGGNVSPEDVDNANPNGVDVITDYSTGNGSGTANDTYLYPPTLDVVALSGSIYEGSGSATPLTEIELAPSPTGEIEMLAANSIYGNSTGARGYGPIDWALSGAALSTEATPFDPAYLLLTMGTTSTPSSSNILSTNYFYINTSATIDRSLFAFGIDTVTTDLHAGDTQPALFYAVNGNIEGLDFGYVGPATFQQSNGNRTSTLVYQGAKAVDIQAGGDIINLGEPYTLPVGNNTAPDDAAFILNANPTDVSVIQAGGSIYYANVVIGGPGTLEVMAGGNIYQGDHGLIESIGPINSVTPDGDTSGANVIVMLGLGSAGPNWSGFADLYFNPADQGDPEQNPGDVAATYLNQLYVWLQQDYGYKGDESGALAYFQGLPVAQQSVFDLQVYFDELNASGLEFNDPSSIRYKSYFRGKEVIATLFPTAGAGSLTMESGTERFFLNPAAGGVSRLYDSGIHTEFGGNIDIVAPGGAVTIGANAIQPGPGTGVMTEGAGDIGIYALDSIELGLSRVFTTFGGNIVMWSADGDINAGRGAKTTVVYPPAQRTYDDWGNVVLSPAVPSTGAGIATLAPIPEVPPGDINLIAPLGTVDAGEAGIRVSGNINIAALQVLNAANIQVQGNSSGLPTVAPVNVSALTAASQAASSAVQAAEQISRQAQNSQPSIISVEILGYGNEQLEPSNAGVNVSAQSSADQADNISPIDPASPIQLVGHGQDFTAGQFSQLTDSEREQLQQDK